MECHPHRRDLSWVSSNSKRQGAVKAGKQGREKMVIWLTYVTRRQGSGRQEQAHRLPAEGKAESRGSNSWQAHTEMPSGWNYHEPGVGLVVRAGTKGEGALTRSEACATGDNPAPRPGSQVSLLPGCGCWGPLGRPAFATGTKPTSAAPAARQNASMSRGGCHLSMGESTKISKKRTWKQKANQQNS